MSIEHWFAFVVASSVLLIIPGPTILTVMSYSLSHGRRAQIPLIAAVALGDTTALILSLAGLGALLATSAWLFIVVKWVGGLYLIYLGIKLIRTPSLVVDNESPGKLVSGWTLFANTWLVTALNPKGIIFFVAFLPQFVNPAGKISTQLWTLSVTFVMLATLNALLYALFAEQARSVLSSPRAQRRFNIGGGTLLTIAGGWALTARQTA
ncbi:MAG: LysE family translocator [Granulosicoccus sp.]